jgi:hypothetical protein
MGVTWKSWHDSPDDGYWDQTIIKDLLTQSGYENVLVTPGHWRDPEPIKAWLSENPAIVWITSDEEGECPFWSLPTPVWKQTPDPQLPYRPDRALPLGYTPHTRPALIRLGYPDTKHGWTFSGQVTNPRREAAMEALRRLGDPLETDTFAAGLDPEAYIRSLWAAAWVPCPAGNVRPETFRMWEALEAGAVPILDATSPAGDRGYWPMVLGDHPLPIIEDWSQVGAILDSEPPLVGPWYTRYKRELRRDLYRSWCRYAGEPSLTPAERISTIITASPIPSHPDFGILTETVESVRARLPGREICIAFDGDPDPDYLEHIRRVAYHANLFWPETWIWHSGVWKHQAGTIRDVLAHVDTGVVLMLEHDTPLVGEIPWHRLVEMLYERKFNSIRFHHETAIPKEHRYLMRAATEQITRTVQYSQRPHLAWTPWYRELLARLPAQARTFVEDWAYGLVEPSHWSQYKLGIYTPEGDIQRSYHLDGRAGAPKREMWW